jgi:hypothetical protein
VGAIRRQRPKRAKWRKQKPVGQHRHRHHFVEQPYRIGVAMVCVTCGRAQGEWEERRWEPSTPTTGTTTPRYDLDHSEGW